MGDFKASARAAHVGRGLPLFSQSLIMGVMQRSGLSLPIKLMASSVPGLVPSIIPMLYHFDLASQTASITALRSLMPRKPDGQMTCHSNDMHCIPIFNKTLPLKVVLSCCNSSGPGSAVARVDSMIWLDCFDLVHCLLGEEGWEREEPDVCMVILGNIAVSKLCCVFSLTV